MDLKRPVYYRGIDLNDADVSTLSASRGKLRGISLEAVSYGAVRGVGYKEKRAQGDGYDASDVYLGLRTIKMRGTIYGDTRAEAFDRLQELRAAFTPSGAYLESPYEYGYLDLQFDEPTENLTEFTNGYRSCFIKARPVAQPEWTVTKGADGGEEYGGESIPFSVELEAIDPRVYIQGGVVIPLTGGLSGSGNTTNRGDYPAPLNILLSVRAAAVAGSFTLNAGGSTLTITIPNSTSDQTIRLSGEKKVLTVEENNVESLRMDLLTFGTDSTWPLVTPGSQGYSWSTTGLVSGDLGTGNDSRIWYWEAFA